MPSFPGIQRVDDENSHRQAARPDTYEFSNKRNEQQRLVDRNSQVVAEPLDLHPLLRQCADPLTRTRPLLAWWITTWALYSWNRCSSIALQGLFISVFHRHKASQPVTLNSQISSRTNAFSYFDARNGKRRLVVYWIQALFPLVWHFLGKLRF